MCRARKRSRPTSGMRVTSVPLTTIRPASTVVSPAMAFSSVVLPPPLRPRMTTCSPAATASRGTSRIASRLPSGSRYDFLTFSTSSMEASPAGGAIERAGATQRPDLPGDAFRKAFQFNALRTRGKANRRLQTPPFALRKHCRSLFAARTAEPVPNVHASRERVTTTDCPAWCSAARDNAASRNARKGGDFAPRLGEKSDRRRDWHALCNRHATVEEWAMARADRSRVRNFRGGSRDRPADESRPKIELEPIPPLARDVTR